MKSLLGEQLSFALQTLILTFRYAHHVPGWENYHVIRHIDFDPDDSTDTVQTSSGWVDARTVKFECGPRDGLLVRAEATILSAPCLIRTDQACWQRALVSIYKNYQANGGVPAEVALEAHYFLDVHTIPAGPFQVEWKKGPWRPIENVPQD